MTAFANTAGTVTSTVNALGTTGKALFNLLSFAADPKRVMAQVNRPPAAVGGILQRPASLPALTGGTSIVDLTEFA